MLKYFLQVTQTFVKKGDFLYIGRKLCEVSSFTGGKKLLLSIKAQNGGRVLKVLFKNEEEIHLK